MLQRSLFTVIASFVFLSSSLAYAEESTTKTQSAYYLCKNGAAVRTIRIQQTNNVCKTFYTKEGVDAMVGKASKMENCTDVANRIRSNLEAGNWKCKEVNQARVSSANE